METIETSGHTWQIGHLHLSPVSQNLTKMKLKEQKASTHKSTEWERQTWIDKIWQKNNW